MGQADRQSPGSCFTLIAMGGDSVLNDVGHFSHPHTLISNSGLKDGLFILLMSNYSDERTVAARQYLTVDGVFQSVECRYIYSIILHS